MKAFRGAAATILPLGEDAVARAVEDGTLTKLPGIGASSAKVITAAVRGELPERLAKLEQEHAGPLTGGAWPRSRRHPTSRVSTASSSAEWARRTRRRAPRAWPARRAPPPGRAGRARRRRSRAARRAPTPAAARPPQPHRRSRRSAPRHEVSRARAPGRRGDRDRRPRLPRRCSHRRAREAGIAGSRRATRCRRRSHPHWTCRVARAAAPRDHRRRARADRSRSDRDGDARRASLARLSPTTRSRDDGRAALASTRGCRGSTSCASEHRSSARGPRRARCERARCAAACDRCRAQSGRRPGLAALLDGALHARRARSRGLGADHARRADARRAAVAARIKHLTSPASTSAHSTLALRRPPGAALARRGWLRRRCWQLLARRTRPARAHSIVFTARDAHRRRCTRARRRTRANVLWLELDAPNVTEPAAHLSHRFGHHVAVFAGATLHAFAGLGRRV